MISGGGGIRGAVALCLFLTRKNEGIRDPVRRASIRLSVCIVLNELSTRQAARWVSVRRRPQAGIKADLQPIELAPRCTPPKYTAAIRHPPGTIGIR